MPCIDLKSEAIFFTTVCMYATFLDFYTHSTFRKNSCANQAHHQGACILSY